jgi:hypothetical protein
MESQAIHPNQQLPGQALTASLIVILGIENFPQGMRNTLANAHGVEYEPCVIIEGKPVHTLIVEPYSDSDVSRQIVVEGELYIIVKILGSIWTNDRPARLPGSRVQSFTSNVEGRTIHLHDSWRISSISERNLPVHEPGLTMSGHFDVRFLINEVRSRLFYAKFSAQAETGTSGIGSIFGSGSRTPSVDRSGDRSAERQEAKGKANNAKQSLKVREEGAGLSGIRRTSLLYKIVCLEAMGLSGVLAAFSITRVFPVNERPKNRWIAGAFAGVIAGFYFLFAGITGELWPIGF